MSVWWIEEAIQILACFWVYLCCTILIIFLLGFKLCPIFAIFLLLFGFSNKHIFISEPFHPIFAQNLEIFFILLFRKDFLSSSCINLNLKSDHLKIIGDFPFWILHLVVQGYDLMVIQQRVGLIQTFYFFSDKLIANEFGGADWCEFVHVETLVFFFAILELMAASIASHTLSGWFTYFERLFASHTEMSWTDEYRAWTIGFNAFLVHHFETCFMECQVTALHTASDEFLIILHNRTTHRLQRAICASCSAKKTTLTYKLKGIRLRTSFNLQRISFLLRLENVFDCHILVNTFLVVVFSAILLATLEDRFGIRDLFLTEFAKQTLLSAFGLCIKLWRVG